MTNKETLSRETQYILNNYGLIPRYVEENGKIRRVYTDQGQFALKSIPAQNGIDFIRNVQSLYQKGYNRIVPIFPTQDGRYAILQRDRLYYLMPWLSNEGSGERFEKHNKMFRELARMHSISAKEITIDKEKREHHFEKISGQWKKQKEFLNEFIKHCEKKWYMSPFELHFCMYYTDIIQALNYAEKKLDEWYEKTKDSEKVRTVITHGKVSLQHFIQDDRGYGHFINFENTRIVPPHFDLLPFLRKSTAAYPQACDDCVGWLYNYFNYFPLKEDEMLLFQSYLAHPGSQFAIVESYLDKKEDKNELKYVTKLLREYWLLKNTEYIVMQVEEREQQKKAAQAQAAE
ncbi:spore coat protein YsxE [Peribacillus saganii]|uniref:Spore coat protein YsxE n=1 Tax=Peribacillus saganii TaxID=2303992 RepID=A0A372LU35_9BACI|nr:spore coat protein YsxE [Peribacillus saganii]RFU71713.1 spore coat protein YsxE [Peribacillus saganii]